MQCWSYRSPSHGAYDEARTGSVLKRRSKGALNYTALTPNRSRLCFSSTNINIFCYYRANDANMGWGQSPEIKYTVVWSAWQNIASCTFFLLPWHYGRFCSLLYHNSGLKDASTLESRLFVNIANSRCTIRPRTECGSKISLRSRECAPFYVDHH